MTTRLVSFKLTVVSRVAVYFDEKSRKNPLLEEIRKTIQEVLNIKELKTQFYSDYEEDMQELAEKYGFKKEDLMDLIPELTHGQ